jgi:6-carboxyhexanoate--CoA ligase
VDGSLLNQVAVEMLTRAKGKFPDSIQITVEAIGDKDCHHIPCLSVQTVLSASAFEAAEFAKRVLASAGVPLSTATSAMNALQHGFSSDGVALRGASLWDSITGKRLEADKVRGVRASRFDYSPEGGAAVSKALAEHGLDHFRTREALALATKVIWSGIVAELCWSDEPSYTTGYVSTHRDGYVRLPGFKPAGATGGRIFFVQPNAADIASIEHRLQKAYALIDPPVSIFEPITAEDFLIRNEH